jgi:F0F1-type ATP synthase membrane subunit b/b'
MPGTSGSSASADPYVQRREARKQAKDEYKQSKKDAKQQYKADKKEADALLKQSTTSGK